MIERVSGASADAMEPVATKNEESTLRNYRVGITRTAYSSEKFVEVVATCAEEAEEQALRLAEDMEFSTTTSELDAECVELGTVEQGNSLIWRDPDTEQEYIVTFELYRVTLCAARKRLATLWRFTAVNYHPVMAHN